jgi:hypothetical protein
MWSSSPLWLLLLRDRLHEPRRSALPWQLPKVEPHIRLWRQVTLHVVGGAVARPAQVFDEGLGLLHIIEADELPPQLEAALCAVNAAVPAQRAVDGIAPVVLVEQAGQDVLIAGDGVSLVQREPCAWERCLNSSSGSGLARVRVISSHGFGSLRGCAETPARSPCRLGEPG